MIAFVGTGEAWVKTSGGTLGNILVGVDLGADRGAVCVLANGTNVYTGYEVKTVPGWLGAAVAFPVCTWPGPNCNGLDRTGVLVNPNTLVTCVYLNGNVLFGTGVCPVL
ncbi:MAG TPA: hypothetical protein VNA20_00505 [Frankiaceae bacterium]|nr:hypothetical protein [Frankiaceae bacterium]